MEHLSRVRGHWMRERVVQKDGSQRQHQGGIYFRGETNFPVNVHPGPAMRYSVCSIQDPKREQTTSQYARFELFS